MQDWEWKSPWDLSPYYKFHIYPNELKWVYYHSKITAQQWKNDQEDKETKDGVSGNSGIYGTKRKYDDILRDAIVGNFGNVVGNMMWFGRKWGLWMFRKSREWADAHPREGDKGSDIPGFQIDWKGGAYYANRSYDIRIKPRGLLNRDHEWGRGRYVSPGVLSKCYPDANYWHKQYYFNFFVHTVDNNHLLENYYSVYNHIRSHCVIVYITGWYKGTDITDPYPMEAKYGCYKDAYCVPIPKLHPLEDFPYGKHLWWWKNGMKKEIKNEHNQNQ
jgi:hypothetical protein